jgi:[FeFe] hydrogenase H-cluster maturation GTPase HydF
MTEREIIGIFGKMNSGKSSMMNLITQQETSIVDATPGTTADTKITLMEIHGLGPVKILDTAGYDESDELGEKKRRKVIAALKESDLVLLLIDPATEVFDTEKFILEEAFRLEKQILLIWNLFRESDKLKIPDVSDQLPLLKKLRSVSVSAMDISHRQPLLDFILAGYIPKHITLELLPFVEKDRFYILNIPMDEETPPGRYLRPQAMAEEYITRHWAYPVSYRMDLGKARSGDPVEKDRWENFLRNFHDVPGAVITDSQAMDIMKSWTPENIPLTTFSIMMINYMSRGRIRDFATAAKILDTLKPGDKILIAEACNHSRIREDIGTVQIPKLIGTHFPGVIIDHAFGREFEGKESLDEYKLVIHCGGCMITPQQVAARLRDLGNLGVPITNYGVFLSYMQGKATLARVMAPWSTTAAK